MNFTCCRVLSGASAAPVTKWSLGRTGEKDSDAPWKKHVKGACLLGSQPKISHQYLINSQARCYQGSHSLFLEAQVLRGSLHPTSVQPAFQEILSPLWSPPQL